MDTSPEGDHLVHVETLAGWLFGTTLCCILEYFRLVFLCCPSSDHGFFHSRAPHLHTGRAFRRPWKPSFSFRTCAAFTVYWCNGAFVWRVALALSVLVSSCCLHIAWCKPLLKTKFFKCFSSFGSEAVTLRARVQPEKCFARDLCWPHPRYDFIRAGTPHPNPASVASGHYKSG